MGTLRRTPGGGVELVRTGYSGAAGTVELRTLPGAASGRRYGHACSYMIGELKLVELREKMKKAMGDRFSLREYHNLVLRTGAVPLEILARQVDRYISTGRA